MGHHHLLPYIHGHSHHHQHNPSADVPKGCVAVRVGKEGYDDEPQRFVVPVEYLNHPLFYGLLKVAEDEYGFDQKGTFTLPCRVKEFQSIQELIHQDMHNHHHNHHHHHEQHQHQHHHHHHEQHQHQYHQHFKTNSGGSSAGAHHLHLTGCFKA